jgi:FtsP/CotA-like multicopper oxidase with cupredoxin domain
VAHFQIVSTVAPDFIVRVGEYRDVVLGTSKFDPLPATSEVVRFHTFDYDGVYIFHCHIAEHEDAGMMGGFNVKQCSRAASNIQPASMIVAALAILIAATIMPW